LSVSVPDLITVLIHSRSDGVVGRSGSKAQRMYELST